MCFIQLSAFEVLLRNVAGKAYTHMREESQAKAEALRAELAKKLREPEALFLAAKDPVQPVAHAIYQIERSGNEETDEVWAKMQEIPRMRTLVTAPKARKEAQEKLRATTMKMIEHYQKKDRRGGNALQKQYEQQKEEFIHLHVGTRERILALGCMDPVMPNSDDAGLDQKVLDFKKKSCYEVRTVDMQTKMTNGSRPQAQAKGASDTRSVSGGKPERKAKSAPEQVWNRLKKLRLQVQVHGDGGETMVIMNPEGAKRLRAAMPAFEQVAAAKDACLAQAKEQVHYVSDLDVLKKQLQTCEDLFKTMEELRVDWEHGLPMVLPWLEVATETLKLLKTKKANMLLLKRMAETARGVCSIKYLTCMQDNKLEVPVLNMHEGEKQMNKYIEDLRLRVFVAGPKGYSARCSVGGTFGSLGEHAYALATAALVGAYRGCEEEELHKVIRSDESLTQQLLNVPFVMHPPNTPAQTQATLQQLLGYPDASFEVTEGDLTHAKTPNNTFFSNLTLVGKMRNENPYILFEQLEQVLEGAPKGPEYMSVRPGSSVKLPKLLKPTQEIPPELQSLMLQIDSRVDEATIAALHDHVQQELGSAGEKRGRDGEPAEASHSCLLVFDNKGNPKEAVVIEKEKVAKYCAEISYKSYSAAADRVCAATTQFQGTETEKLDSGASSLQKALGVESLDSVAFIGLQELTAPVWEVKARKHDGGDDHEGKPVSDGKVEAGEHNGVPWLRFETPENFLIKFTIVPWFNGKILPVYLDEDGGEEEYDLQDLDDAYELPIPLQRDPGNESTDGWVLRSKTKKPLGKLLCYPQKDAPNGEGPSKCSKT